MKRQETNIYTIAKEAGVSIATVSRVINQSAPVNEKSRKKVLDAIATTMKRQETNIYTIAKEAGVSIATVSRVINQSAPVNEKSRKKVLDAIEKLNYVPNLAARNLSTSSSNSIGIVIPDVKNMFFMQLLQGITLAADQMGYNVILFNSSSDVEREHRVLDYMRELRLRAVIITPVCYSDWETIQKLKDFESFGIPVMLLDRELIAHDFDRVVSSDEEGSFLAVSELIRQGHRKIALISGPECVYPVFKRLNGYFRAMRQAGITVREEYVRKSDFTMETACRALISGPECVYPVFKRLNGYFRAMRQAGITVREEYVRKSDFTMETACREATALCQLPDPPTAIFSFNNNTTYGCLKAFGDIDWKIGRDIALIGFDDIEELDWLHCDISVVSRDVQRMGQIAMEQLQRRMDTESEDDTSFVTNVPATLILRGSERFPTRVSK